MVLGKDLTVTVKENSTYLACKMILLILLNISRYPSYIKENLILKRQPIYLKSNSSVGSVKLGLFSVNSFKLSKLLGAVK